MKNLVFFLAMSLFAFSNVSAQLKNDPKALKACLEDGIYALINTGKGNILLRLEPEKAPLTTANFVSLAEGTRETNITKIGQSVYVGNKFHRVLANFMIQGGAEMSVGAANLDYRLKDEFHPDLNHNRPGTLSMANTGQPNTGSCQFFITHVPTAWLNNKHAVFGYVVAGQDVVDKIAQDDVMNTISIIRVGADYEAWDANKIFKELNTF